MPASAIEAVVVKSAREYVKPQKPIDDRTLKETHVVRVEVFTDHLIVQFAKAARNYYETTGPKCLLSEGTPPQQVRRTP